MDKNISAQKLLEPSPLFLTLRQKFDSFGLSNETHMLPFWQQYYLLLFEIAQYEIQFLSKGAKSLTRESYKRELDDALKDLGESSGYLSERAVSRYIDRVNALKEKAYDKKQIDVREFEGDCLSFLAFIFTLIVDRKGYLDDDLEKLKLSVLKFFAPADMKLKNGKRVATLDGFSFLIYLAKQNELEEKIFETFVKSANEVDRGGLITRTDGRSNYGNINLPKFTENLLPKFKVDINYPQEGVLDSEWASQILRSLNRTLHSLGRNQPNQ